MMLTQERLKQVLEYDPETGHFTRIARGVKNTGKRAGCLHHSGYWVIKVDFKQYRASRLAWLYVRGSFPDGDIDHKSTNRLDDSLNNLREATGRQNQGNKNASRNNKSGFKGVHKVDRKTPWKAFIKSDGRMRYLGCFKTAEDAARAYDAAAVAQFGEFARTNFPASA